MLEANTWPRFRPTAAVMTMMRKSRFMFPTSRALPELASQSLVPSRYRANVSQFFKGVEHLEPWALKITVIACHDRQVVADGCCGDVAVFDRHSLPFALKICPKLRPAYCGRDAKA